VLVTLAGARYSQCRSVLRTLGDQGTGAAGDAALETEAKTGAICIQARRGHGARPFAVQKERFGHFTPFYVNCPLNAIEDVARGLRPEACVRFLLKRHVIEVGADEWNLDGDLELWQKARAYAGELNHQGYLKAVQGQGELVYQRKGGKDAEAN
jgi:hypothetical protein